MQACENVYLARESVLRPVDPRMQKVQFAIHTWMLKVAGIIPSTWSQQPTTEQIKNGARDEWSTFRELWAKHKHTRLEDKEWEKLKQQFTRLAVEVLQRAHIIACTPAVVASELFKATNFDDVLNDETSVTTALELLTAWRSIENLVMIGDDNQLAPPVFTGAEQNPFYRFMAYSPFARFRDLHLPAFLLTEQMRMPAGMMHLSNDVIYAGKLKDGKGTALADNPDAQHFKTYLRYMYPSIKPEPEDLLYPVMLNIHGESAVEGKGTSVYNAYNVAAAMDEIIKLLRSLPAATSSNVGIATPYRAQLRKYRRALIKANKRFPELGLLNVRIGTAEFWQGKELKYMFVDLVRASNDAAMLGFIRDSRRLNVLITRQALGLFIIGDERCVLTLAQQSERDNPIPTNEDEPIVEEESAGKAEKKSPEDRKNATVIAIFDWMRQSGRVVNVAKETLTEDYVDFPAPYSETDDANMTGWGDNDTSTDAPTKANETSPTAAENDTSTNAPANDNEISSTAAIEEDNALHPEDHYEDDALLDKEGEEVIKGDDEDGFAASAHQDSSEDFEDGDAGGVGVEEADQLGEDGWNAGASNVHTLKGW